EQARVLASHRLEADLVDDQQRDVHILAPAHACRRDGCVAAQLGEQLLEAKERDAEAILDRLHSEADREVCLAYARGAWEQHRGLLSDEGTGGKQFDLAWLDTGLEGEVEGRQRLALRQAGELERGAATPLLTLPELLLQHSIEEAVRRLVLLCRQAQQVLDPLRSSREAESAQQVAGAVEADGRLASCGHRAASARAA